MSYLIVMEKETIAGQPFGSYDEALAQANRLFGDDVKTWLALNLRIEEDR